MKVSPNTSLQAWVLSVALLCGRCAPARASDAAPPSAAPAPPFVAGRLFTDGVVRPVPPGTALADVFGCCAATDLATADCLRGACAADSRRLTRVKIGAMPQMSAAQAGDALRSAVAAWDGGAGAWPQLALAERVAAVRAFLRELEGEREAIANVLMHEIGKNRKDAEAEFDRTVQFVEKTIDYIETSGDFGGWEANGSTRLFLSRAAIGIVLCLGPYNYPLNETYATLIPALLMGNVAILKLPTVGGLAHLLTMEAFAKVLPPGTINFVSGSGRTTMPPLMESGRVDALAFIGGSRAADRLIKAHPAPHRLKLFLQLEAKNMGVYLPNLFQGAGDAALTERVMKETVAGTLSYNGQRCTALKLLFVPREHGEEFAEDLARRVEALLVGLPWEAAGSTFSQITPLPNQERVDYMKELIEDAIAKGARIVNENGGAIVGGGPPDGESTLMVPAVLYPVSPGMRVFDEEQFGPVVPVAPYDNLDEVLRYARDGKYGQQASLFTAEADAATTRLVDRFAAVFGKINVNAQCGRSPDTAPFSGRRSSALGVMSVRDALHEFSVPVVVSHKDVGDDAAMVRGLEGSSFLAPAVGVR